MEEITQNKGIYEIIDEIYEESKRKYLVIYEEQNGKMVAKEIITTSIEGLYDELIKLWSYHILYIFTESEMIRASKRATKYTNRRNKVISKRYNTLQKFI